MLDKIKKLRKQTGLGVMQCKKALSEANGDNAKALKILAKISAQKAVKRADREAGQGLIEAYIHSNGKIGALVELRCETDFVVRNPEFRELAHDLAMQICAVPAKNKAELLKQDFIKNQDLKVSDLIKEKIAKIGEKIELKDFKRLEI
ncbi:translation elongation factor Ts [bacterium]|nr:translation elongation factor Ts [bacterium]